MEIREANQKDYKAISTLFEGTVRNINSRDYTPEEVDAWANCSRNENSWKKRLDEQTFYLIEEGREVIGFGSIAKYGYLDFMFVHKDHQGKGIAKKILDQIELKGKEQKNREVYAFVSKTAESFFERQGYEPCGKRYAYLNEIEFVNSVFRKRLNPNDALDF